MRLVIFSSPLGLGGDFFYMANQNQKYINPAPHLSPSKRNMKPVRFSVLIGVVFLLLAIPALADTNTGWPCANDQTCQQDLGGEAGTRFYCQEGICFQAEAAPAAVLAPTSPAPRTATSSSDSRITGVEASVSTLQTDTSLLDQDVSTAKQDIQSLRTQLSSVQVQTAQLANDVVSLSQSVASLRTELGPKVSNALAGQAVLMQGLNMTQQELSQVSDSLNTEKMVTYLFFILLIIAIALGIAYYITHLRGGVNEEVYQYITKNIKAGKKFPLIRESLQKAGWSNEDIAKAYKETIKRNYQQYRQQAGSSVSPVSAPSLRGTPAKGSTPSTVGLNAGTRAKPSAMPSSNRNKIIAIVVISILLLGGVVFLLSGTVGKAIATAKLVGGVEGGKAGVVEYTIDCTPPHILTPDRNSCCLDTKTKLENGTLTDGPNEICDNAEERAVAEVQGGACTDNNQCGGEYCVDGTCRSLASIYQGSPQCDKMCNYYSVRMSTSDGETYTIKPNKGSYTAAGALEWKVLIAPDHCEGERVVVPIMITTKEPGKVLTEQVITLRQGQTSPRLTHPSIDHISFNLKASSVYELCHEV